MCSTIIILVCNVVFVFVIVVVVVVVVLDDDDDYDGDYDDKMKYDDQVADYDQSLFAPMLRGRLKGVNKISGARRLRGRRRPS